MRTKYYLKVYLIDNHQRATSTCGRSGFGHTILTDEIDRIEQRDNVTIAGILPVCRASKQKVSKAERKQNYAKSIVKIESSTKVYSIGSAV